MFIHTTPWKERDVVTPLSGPSASRRGSPLEAPASRLAPILAHQGTFPSCITVWPLDRYLAVVLELVTQVLKKPCIFTACVPLRPKEALPRRLKTQLKTRWGGFGSNVATQPGKAAKTPLTCRARDSLRCGFGKAQVIVMCSPWGEPWLGAPAAAV